MDKIHDEFLLSIFKSINKSIEGNNKEGSPIIKRTYLRLADQNIEKNKAIDGIASVLLEEMYFALQHDDYELFKERFQKNMDNLPSIPLIN